jgi:hypothetical protein
MRPRWIVAVVALALAPAAAEAQVLDTREWSLRQTAYEPVYDVTRADLRFSWRTDAVGATATTALDGGASVTQATASLAAEVAISHEACDLLVAGGQADARSGDTPLAFQQWASFCPLSGAMRIAIAHHLAWDVRARLLAPPRQRPGDQRQETITFEMSGWRERVNDPGPLSLAPPPPEWMAFVASKTDLAIGWQAQTTATSGPLDLSMTSSLYSMRFERERADNGPPLEVWVIGMRAMFLAHENGTDDNSVAMAARMDAFRLTGARLAGLRVGADLGIAMGSATDATPQLASMLTGVGGVSVERDFLRGAEDLATLGATAARDVWPLWDGRVVIDDRATLSYGMRKQKLRLRGELAAARTHLLAADATLTTGVNGGFTGVAEYDLSKHVTLRSRNELGWSVYAPGATADAPRRAVEAMITAVLHAGNR